MLARLLRSLADGLCPSQTRRFFAGQGVKPKDYCMYFEAEQRGAAENPPSSRARRDAERALRKIFSQALQFLDSGAMMVVLCIPTDRHGLCPQMRLLVEMDARPWDGCPGVERLPETKGEPEL